MLEIREAEEGDAKSIREIFEATYGGDYAYPEIYREHYLKKLIYADDTLILVAKDPTSGDVVGTASVVLESGAYTDLVGEFGRLAVHPKAWGRGIGGRLLEERVKLVEHRLHVGFMEARLAHPYSLANGLRHGFAPVGYLPLKLRFGSKRENAVLLVRYFGDALALRRNHPRVIPEACQLAGEALDQIGLSRDIVVDEKAAPYPPSGDYGMRELTAQGYSSLLRIERGRLRNREIFGPLRLHYGFFRLRAEHSNYLIAHTEEHIAGGVGYTLDEAENVLRIFELICLEDEAVRFLLGELERKCREDYGVVYLEIDVNAHSPRMQRTLLEMGYLPAAYVPALAFHRVERLDVLKMARLLIPLERDGDLLEPPVQALAELILRGFHRQELLPRIGELVDRIGLFAGLTQEQLQRLAVSCGQAAVEAGERVFSRGEPCNETYLILDGEVEIRLADEDRAVGVVGPGECLGEVSLLMGTSHSADAVALRPVRAAVLPCEDLVELVRQRPDIGVVLFRNLARGLGEKLRRTDFYLIEEDP
jgi:GNAT superfamily N-acetyltransferase